MKIQQLIISILLTSCSTTTINNKQFSTIDINTQNAIEQFDLSSIIKNDIDIVQMEIKEDCFFTSDAKLMFTNDNIIVADKINNKILNFNKNGNFLNSIGHKGRGPHEFIEITGVDNDSDFVYVSDDYQTKVIKYPINSGNTTVMKFSPEIYHKDLVVTENFYYLNTNYSTADGKFVNIISIDKTDNSTKYYLSYASQIYKNSSRWTLLNNYSNYLDETLFIYSRNDTIYSISEKKIKPKYIVDIKHNKIPESNLSENGGEILTMCRQNGYNSGPEYIYNTKKYVIIISIEGSQSYYTIYNKTNNETITAKNLIISTLGDIPVYAFTTTKDGKLVIVYDAITLKQVRYIVDKGNYSAKTTLMETLDTVNENSNPVLFISEFI